MCIVILSLVQLAPSSAMRMAVISASSTDVESLSNDDFFFPVYTCRRYPSPVT